MWTCGGTLLIVTCSHVGHVFRKATPYTFPGGTGHIINHNNARLADVWMDDWRNFFYRISPGSVGQMTNRQQLVFSKLSHVIRILLIFVSMIAGIDPVGWYGLVTIVIAEIFSVSRPPCCQMWNRQTEFVLFVTH